MADETATAAPAAPAAKSVAKSVPSHVVLLEDHADLLAGRVTRVDLDRLAMLDTEGAKYRLATEREISIAGL